MELPDVPKSDDVGPDDGRRSTPHADANGPAPIAPSRWWHRAALVSVGALLAVGLIVPIVRLYLTGSVFGADWSEYLYSGPTYFLAARPLFQYPYPLLPVAYLPLDHLLPNGSLTAVLIVEVVSALLLVAGFFVGYLVCSAHARSHWAGIVGGLVLGGYPLLQLEIGWGGQAQLVAYDLGLLSLWVVLSRVLPSRSIGFSLVAGGLLSLAVLSEFYSAAVIGLSLLLFLPLALGRGIVSKRGAEIWAAVFGPAAATIGFLLLEFPGATNPASGGKLSTYWRYGPLYHQLWEDLTFHSLVLAGVYVSAVLLYAGFRVFVRSRSPAEGWLVPVLGISALAVGAFLTPALNSSRALYPLVFPLALGLSEIAGLTSRESIQRSRPNRWRRSSSALPRAYPVLVVATLVITAAQLGASLEIYPSSLALYTYDQGVISELTFLQQEPGAILYDSAPVDHMFVNLWGTDRPIYPGPAFEPYTVTNAPGQAAVVLGTTLSYAENWIDDGSFILTGAEPAWGQPAPGLLLVKNAHIYSSIESNDFENSVSYSPDSNPTRTYTSDLFYATSITTTARGDQLSTSYVFPGFQVNRTLLISEQGTEYWNYSYRFLTSIPRAISFHITDSSHVDSVGTLLTNTTAGSAAELTQQFAEAPLPPVAQQYSIRAESGNSNLSTSYIPSNQYGIMEFDYGLAPSGSSTRSVFLNVTILPEGAGGGPAAAHSQLPVLTQAGIQWVVLSRSSSDLILQRFMDDPQYALFRITPHYYVLSVA